MSKILVTGGLGFIGHNVVLRLKNLGHDVIVLDTQTNYGIIPQSEIDYLMRERSKKVNIQNVYRIDVSNQDNVEYLFRKHNFDIVVHLASFPRQKVVNSNPSLGSRVMIEGLLNLCESGKKHNIKKFVYISSSMVYGNFYDDVSETTVCNPQGQYGIMKLAGEDLVKDYGNKGNFNHVIIRPSAVYGPLDVEDRVVAKFLLNAMRGEILKVNGPTEKLDFTYVDDIADGIVLATLNDVANKKVYNITKGLGKTLLEAAELAIRIAGKGSLEIHERDYNFPSRGKLNIDRAKNDLNFNPKVDIEEGFVKYYEWLYSSEYFRTKL